VRSGNLVAKNELEPQRPRRGTLVWNASLPDPPLLEITPLFSRLFVANHFASDSEPIRAVENQFNAVGHHPDFDFAG
jgi:hypothetical protein